MYIVRFIQKEGKPYEDYYYNIYEDALKHFELFREDDSSLYALIMLLNNDEIINIRK